MRQPEFDVTRAKWDQYRRFHVTHKASGYYYAPFVQFENGEFILRVDPDRKPQLRKHYAQFNIDLVSSSDRQFPKHITDPDGKDIKVTWLEHEFGQQVFLWDHEHKMLVSTGNYVRQHYDNVPKHMNDARVWYPNANAQPIGCPISISEPRPRTKEENDHIRQLRDACRAWKAMQDRDYLSRYQPLTYQNIMTVGEVMKLNFADMRPEMRILFLRCAINGPRMKRTVPYLKVKT